jgi:hypothetical protein
MSFEIYFLVLVFEDNSLRYEKDIYLSSTKLDDSFYVNMKTFRISMISHFHRNEVSPPKEWLCNKAVSSFLQAVKPIKEIRSDTN